MTTPEEALASRLKVYAEIARANAAYEKRSVGDLSGYDDQANDLEAAARAILASGALQQHIDIMTREHAEERAELEQDLVAYIRDVARIADAADVPFDEPAAMADDLRRKLASLNADRARLAALKEKCAPIADWTRLEELHGSTIGHEDIPDDERVVVIAGLLHIDLCSVGDLRELARAVNGEEKQEAEE